MEPMNIFQLQEYAKDNGYDSGRFICMNKKGFFEFQWLDAYYGFVTMVQPEPKEKGFITVGQLIELFGDKQIYVKTIGYDENEED